MLTMKTRDMHLAATSIGKGDMTSTVEPSMEYKKQSLDLLKNLYPNVNFYAIRRAFQYESPSYNFTAAYHKLTSIDSGEEPNYLSTLKNIRVKNPRKAKSFQTTDPILLQEIDAIPALNQKENAPPQANQAPPPPPPPDVVVSPEVTWECSCCFGDDFASGEMGHCGDGTHFFCIDCLEQYAQTQVEADGSLNCFCDDECTSIIPKCFRDKLPSALTDNLDDRAFRASVLKAGLEGICKCPKCAYLFELDPRVADAIGITCSQCRTKFCPTCKNEPHPKKTCQEAEQEKLAGDARAQAAEAMTAAVVRHCPDCDTAFFKEEGCNKMTCPQCKILICYLCRKKIKDKTSGDNSDYAHFCRTPFCTHKNCGKCILFTDTKQDDLLARREAGAQELARAKVGQEAIALLLTPEREQARPRPSPERVAAPEQQHILPRIVPAEQPEIVAAVQVRPAPNALPARVLRDAVPFAPPANNAQRQNVRDGHAAQVPRAQNVRPAHVGRAAVPNTPPANNAQPQNARDGVAGPVGQVPNARPDNLGPVAGPDELPVNDRQRQNEAWFVAVWNFITFQRR